MRRFLLALTAVLQVNADFPKFQALVQKEGFVAEKHDVYTDDGWRLSMIRIYSFDKLNSEKNSLVESEEQSGDTII